MRGWCSNKFGKYPMFLEEIKENFEKLLHTKIKGKFL